MEHLIKPNLNSISPLSTPDPDIEISQLPDLNAWVLTMQINNKRYQAIVPTYYTCKGILLENTPLSLYSTAQSFKLRVLIDECRQALEDQTCSQNTSKSTSQLLH